MFATKLIKKPDPTKAKEQYELFLKYDDIKPADVKYFKTASSLLKPIEQSIIFTQELETIEKPNIFNKKLVIIEHPKTATKLSRSKKIPKIVNQQPKKQKFIQGQKPLIVRYN